MNFWKSVIKFLDDEVDPEEAIYDPVHVGAAILLVLFGMTIIFWDLWALLVYKGGIVTKVIPGLVVLFTSKTAADYGYEGYPYELGVFDGWIGNLGALIFLIVLLSMIAWLFKSTKELDGRHS